MTTQDRTVPSLKRGRSCRSARILCVARRTPQGSEVCSPSHRFSSRRIARSVGASGSCSDAEFLLGYHLHEPRTRSAPRTVVDVDPVACRQQRGDHQATHQSGRQEEEDAPSPGRVEAPTACLDAARPRSPRTAVRRARTRARSQRCRTPRSDRSTGHRTSRRSSRRLRRAKHRLLARETGFDRRKIGSRLGKADG